MKTNLRKVVIAALAFIQTGAEKTEQAISK
jgi:hypothetical protein